ncbi:MAG: hypothetical protein ACE5KT_06325 [Methanosarcinales archaeon]
MKRSIISIIDKYYPNEWKVSATGDLYLPDCNTKDPFLVQKIREEVEEIGYTTEIDCYNNLVFISKKL